MLPRIRYLSVSDSCRTSLCSFPIPKITNNHGAHKTLIFQKFLFHFNIRHWSHDFRGRAYSMKLPFSSISSSDEERQPERAHVASAKEEKRFYYQSRRAHHKTQFPTIWSQPRQAECNPSSSSHTHFGQP